MPEFHDKRTGRAVTVERQDADTVQLHLQPHKTTADADRGADRGRRPVQHAERGGAERRRAATAWDVKHRNHPMRASLCFIAAVAVSLLPTIHLHAQECRRDERWLLLTVQVERLVDSDNLEAVTETTAGAGPQLFDLCDIVEMRAVSDDVTRSAITVRPLTDSYFHFVVVDESLKEICAVLVGCMDATEGQK